MKKANRHGSAMRRNALASCILAGFVAAPVLAADIPSGPMRAARETAPRSGNDARTPLSPVVFRGDRSRPAALPATFGTHGSVIVTNCNDSGQGSLRDAMLNADEGVVIELLALPCSTIMLTSGALEATVSVMLLGPGAEQLTIDGDAVDSVIRHDGPVLNVHGLALVNGRDASGMGGCVRSTGDVNIENSIVSGCSSGGAGVPASLGGGIHAGGQLSLGASKVTGNTALGRFEASGGGAWAGGNVYIGSGSIISANRADASEGGAHGGGVFSHGSVSIGGQTRIADNEAVANFGVASGGGIHAEDMDLLVMDSTISGNTALSGSARAEGGGIQAGGDAGVPPDLYLIGSTLSGNTAQTLCAQPHCIARGGGASALGSITAKYSTVRDNAVLSPAQTEALSAGGGLSTLAAGMAGRISLQSSTVSGNSAIGGAVSGMGYGGGAIAKLAYFEVTNSTIAFNSANTRGGGLVAANDPEGAASTLVSSIVAHNYAPAGPDIDLVPSVPGVLTVTGNDNIVLAASPTVVLPPDTLASDPLLQPLQSNGGATATHAIPSCSPALDAGSNPEALDHDQRQAPYVRESGSATDIGAYELQEDLDRMFNDGFEPATCP